MNHEQKFCIIVFLGGIIQFGSASISLSRNFDTTAVLYFLISVFLIIWAGLILIKSYKYLLYRAILTFALIPLMLTHMLLTGIEFGFSLIATLFFYGLLIYVAIFHDLKHYKRNEKRGQRSFLG